MVITYRIWLWGFTHYFILNMPRICSWDVNSIDSKQNRESYSIPKLPLNYQGTITMGLTIATSTYWDSIYLYIYMVIYGYIYGYNHYVRAKRIRDIIKPMV